MPDGDDLAGGAPAGGVVGDADVVGSDFFDVGHMPEPAVAGEGVPLRDGPDGWRAVDLVCAVAGADPIVPLVGVAERGSRIAQTVLLQFERRVSGAVVHQAGLPALTVVLVGPPQVLWPVPSGRAAESACGTGYLVGCRGRGRHSQPLQGHDQHDNHRAEPGEATTFDGHARNPLTANWAADQRYQQVGKHRRLSISTQVTETSRLTSSAASSPPSTFLPVPALGHRARGYLGPPPNAYFIQLQGCVTWSGRIEHR